MEFSIDAVYGGALYCMRYSLILFMFRSQLYLPDETYKKVKDIAAAKNITFAAYVRNCIDEKVARESFVIKENPLLKWAGFLKGSKNSSDNKEIDKFLYGY